MTTTPLTRRRFEIYCGRTPGHNSHKGLVLSWVTESKNLQRLHVSSASYLDAQRMLRFFARSCKPQVSHAFDVFIIHNGMNWITDTRSSPCDPLDEKLLEIFYKELLR